jgi:lipid A ethanolaminephosphotransferase
MLFLGATLIVIVAIYNLLLQLISWKWSAKFFASLLIIIGGLSAYFVNSLGVIITPDQIQNLLQTDVRKRKICGLSVWSSGRSFLFFFHSVLWQF